MSPKGSSEGRLLPGRFAAFILLFAFWLIFSGHYDAFHITLGVLCSGLVAYTSHSLLLANIISGSDLVTVWRFTLYIPWLIYQIVVANLHVVYLVFNVKEINPRIVRFRTKLDLPLARVTLANSITLTPGTITMDMEDREFQVVNTHLPYEFGLRNRCLDLLPRLLDAESAIVTGDFNTTTRNLFFRDFLLATGLRPAGTEEPTHDSGRRIDFVLHRGGFREVGYSLTKSLSDHRVVRAELEV